MSILSDKKIIIIGDRDGISARTIEECFRNEPSVEVVYSATEFFTKTMDLDSQLRIRAIAGKYGAGNTLVIIGTGEKDSTRLVAQTLTSGDPSGNGALAGVALRLPMIHALEDVIKDAAGVFAWEEHLQMYKTILDYDGIVSELQAVRG